MKNFLNFLINEDIKINGKDVPNEDEEKNNPPDYTEDNNEDEPTSGDDPTAQNDTSSTNDINIPANANDASSDEENSPDYTGDNNEDEPTTGEDQGNIDGEQSPDYTGDSNEDGISNDEGNDANGEDKDTPPDYTEDDGDDETGDEDIPEGDENNPDNTDEDPEMDTANTEPQATIDSDINQLQADLFAQLSPKQIEIKLRNLKEQYISLYEDIIKVIDRLGKINRIDITIQPIEFVEKKLNELKDMVKDSLTDSFDTRSYAENQIILQKQIAIYVSLCKIIEGIAKKGENEE